MSYPYESIVLKKEIPMFLLMTSVKYVAMHWHDRIEFLLVLNGNIKVFVGNEQYSLKKDDLLLINYNEVHGVEANNDNRALLLQIPINFIKNYYENIEMEKFECKSFLDDSQENFNLIRYLMAKLAITLKNQNEGYHIKIHSLLLDIIYELIRRFRVEQNKLVRYLNNKKNIERLTRLTNYIENHYMHPLTLNELADIEQLSVPYLSRFFQQLLGQSFIKYLNGIRLEHAVRYLIETDWSIIQIALKCGFSNLNYFHKIFKETFHTTPLQYRKRHQRSGIQKPSKIKKGRKDYDYVEMEDFGELYKYLMLFEKDKNI
ncbi:AraC family transcriptional regulator [Caldifermentibacillus hisashii]|uniref:helix-turn-helix domain-containing protein n=1 Tax=Caldifermentibacillus hisashii TaxID=996558 RepID=UPI0031FD999A